MALDCCSLLTSVLAVDVVAAASRVGPAGSTPSTVVLGIAAGEEINGMSALMGGVFSEQPTLPTAKTATSTAIGTTPHERANRPDFFELFMLDPKFLMCTMIAPDSAQTHRMALCVGVGKGLTANCFHPPLKRCVGGLPRGVGALAAGHLTRRLYDCALATMPAHVPRESPCLPT